MEGEYYQKNSFDSFWKIPPSDGGERPYLVQHPSRGLKPRLVRFGRLGHLYVTVDDRDQIDPVPSSRLDFHPDEAVENLLFERYRKVKESKNFCLGIYYRTRSLMPRGLQLLLRRLYSHRQRRKIFPKWPLDPSLYELHRFLLACEMKARGVNSIKYLSFWPGGKRFCFVLTHDVETEAGFRRIDLLAQIERERGIHSSWNIVPERYAYPEEKLGELAAEGFEIGLHGLLHDGMLFRSREVFDERLPRLNEYFVRLGSDGFRSPATHRNPEWIPELKCSYDSSFPDTDPFEPQAGGSLSLFPYFIDSILELPYTLPQDHTLFEILGDRTAARWIDKTERIARCGGMALAIIHPDYTNSEKRLDCVRALLDYVMQRGDAWIALPRDVCRWWRSRSGTAWGESGEPEQADACVQSFGKPRSAEALLERGKLILPAEGGPMRSAPPAGP